MPKSSRSGVSRSSTLLSSTQLPSNTTCHVYFCHWHNLKCILRKEARRSAFTAQTHRSVASYSCATNPPAHPYQRASSARFFELSQGERTSMMAFPCPSGNLRGHGSFLSSHVQSSASRSEVAYARQTLRLPHRVSNHRLKVRSTTHGAARIVSRSTGLAQPTCHITTSVQ